MIFSVRRPAALALVFASASGVLATLSACNGSGSAAVQTPGSADTGSNGASVNPGASEAPVGGTPGTLATVGESCQSAGKRCLGIHWVSYTSGGKPTATEAQAAMIIHTMNQIWVQCGIGFQIEKFEAVDPTQFGLAYGASSQNQTAQIRSTFTTTNDQLLAVTTGPWGTAVNAWTAMPGESPYGAVMESGIVGYGNGIIYAHEFGHYLGLDHASSASELMSPVIHTTSSTVTASECQTAQSITDKYWSAMLRQ